MSLTELDVLVEKLDATKNGTLVFPKVKGQWGVPLTDVYPWYENCVQPWDSWG